MRSLAPHASLISVGVIAAVVLVVYGPGLQLPLAFDDAWSVRLVEGYTFADAFMRTENFGYYRPLYLLGYMLARAAGPAGPALLHTLCLAAHIANAALLSRLARALAGNPDAGMELAVGLLYALNPFVFQAVALPAGLNHLLACLFTLGATLSYARARQSGRKRHWAMCLGLAVLAFLSNEIGVVAGGFCLVYEISRALRLRQWERNAWSFVAAAAPGIAYLLVYPLIPKGAPPEAVQTVADFVQRALYAAQMLAYPFAALAKLIVPDDTLAVVLAACMTVAVCAAVVVARSRWRLLLLAGLLLFAGASVPPLARLSAGYLLNAPRALYVPLAGVAMVWAALALALADTVARAGAGRVMNLLSMPAVRAVGVAVLCAPGAAHAGAQLALHLRVHAPITAIVETALTMPPDQRMLALNMPEWVAPKARRFPVGSEGVIVMAPYVGGDDLVLSNVGQRREVRLAQFPTPFQSELAYVYQTWGERMDAGVLPAALTTAARVLWVRYLTDTLRADWVGGVEPPAVVEGGARATFGQTLQLVAHHIQPCRTGWILATRWRRLPGAQPDPSTATLSMFAQVYDAGGNPIAQQDGALLSGLLAFDQMPAGLDVVDRRWLIGSPAVAPVTVFVGVYDYQTGQRLTAVRPDGAALEHDALQLSAPQVAGEWPECR